MIMMSEARVPDPNLRTGAWSGVDQFPGGYRRSASPAQQQLERRDLARHPCRRRTVLEEDDPEQGGDKRFDIEIGIELPGRLGGPSARNVFPERVVIDQSGHRLGGGAGIEEDHALGNSG